MTTVISPNSKFLYVWLCLFLFSCTKEKFVTPQVLSPKEVGFPTNIPDFALGTYKLVEFNYRLFYPDICQFGNHIYIDSSHYSRYKFTVKPNGIVETWKNDSLQHKAFVTKIIYDTTYDQVFMYLNNNKGTVIAINYDKGKEPKVGDLLFNDNTLFDYYSGYPIQHAVGFDMTYVKTN